MCQHKSDPHHHHPHAHDHDHDHHSAHDHHHHHHAHGHDQHGAPHDHHHDASHVEPPALSRKDKLVMRLEYYVRHNNDHAGSYAGLADEATQLGGEEAAKLIQTAAEYTAPQNELLEKALSLLRSL